MAIPAMCSTAFGSKPVKLQDDLIYDGMWPMCVYMYTFVECDWGELSNPCTVFGVERYETVQTIDDRPLVSVCQALEL
jgi:hypothetical protein